MKNMKTFLALWCGQTLSLVGSGITSMALTIWAFKQQGTVMSVSLLLICNFVPAAIVSMFAGAVIDRHSKKAIMLIADSCAALTTIFLLLMNASGALRIGHLYLVNVFLGVSAAFQSPASSVTVSALVPQEQYLRASGLQSLSGSLKDILSPVLAAAILAFGGLNAVLIIDLSTFAFAFVTLCLLRIPDVRTEPSPFRDRFAGGFRYLKEHKGILHLICYMMLINFIAGIGFFSLLSPMILKRTGGDELQLGLVNSCIGFGALAGAALLTVWKPRCSRVTLMGVSFMLSYLSCDFLLGVGRSLWVWCFAAFAGSLPLPLGSGALSTLFRENVPITVQGRVFAIRTAFINVMIVLGYIVGAFLADHVAEPLVAAANPISHALRWLLGTGDGRAMGFVFILTCLIGLVSSLSILHDQSVRALEK